RRLLAVRLLAGRLLVVGLFVVLLLKLAPPTAQERGEPGAGLADDLISLLMFGRNGVVLIRRLDRRPATTSRRPAEPGSGLADHRAVGAPAARRVVIRFHGRAD
ncbi:MAG: hypothetical protein ACRDRC_09690, partial [Pseudonocardiaceae bacterium]